MVLNNHCFLNDDKDRQEVDPQLWQEQSILVPIMEDNSVLGRSTSYHSVCLEQDNNLTMNPNPSESVIGKEMSDSSIDLETPKVVTSSHQLSLSSDAPLEIGDHVYSWVSAFGIPAVFQHHAIVIDVWKQNDEWMIGVADFSNFGPIDDDSNLYNISSAKRSPHEHHASSKVDVAGSTSANGYLGISKSNTKHSSGFVSKGPGCLRTYTTTTENWYKVAYRAGFWKSNLSRSGTSTSAPCDRPGLVLARVYFLLNHPDCLPKYDTLTANCECVAVWCKTGTWGTVQATSWLATTIAGQAKSAATLAGIATTAQVTVPSAGFWGWLGYTSQVSLASTQPLLLPAIAAYGVVTVGVPTIALIMAKSKWQNLTMEMNQKFWEDVVDHPDLFAECITHWSGLHDPSETRR